SQDPLHNFRNNFAVDTFASLQRGRVNNPLDPAVDLTRLQQFVANPGPNVDRLLANMDPQTHAPPVAPTLWNPEGLGIAATDVAGYWRNRAGSRGHGTDGTDTSHNFPGIPDNTLGYLNEPFRGAAATDPVRDRLMPGQPFQWLTWNNRPFLSSAEL